MPPAVVEDFAQWVIAGFTVDCYLWQDSWFLSHDAYFFVINLTKNYELNQLVEAQFSESFSTSCNKCKHEYNRFCVMNLQLLLNDVSASNYSSSQTEMKYSQAFVGSHSIFSCRRNYVFLHTSVFSFQVAFKRKHSSCSVLYSDLFILNGFHICCLASFLLICDQETGILLCH